MNFVQGEFYHVYNRGNNRQPIFFNERNYLFFLKKVREQLLPFSEIIAYCLMPNHFHLLLETPEPNLSRTGHWLNVSYSVWFNRRHRRSGHLFEGRFGAVIIEDDANFQEVGRYLHLNPVRVQAMNLGKSGWRTILK